MPLLLLINTDGYPSAEYVVASTKPSEESRKVISEETNVADRFRKLAGLIK